MDVLKKEKELKRKGFRVIACLDESGRGPLAGPVVACALTSSLKKNLTPKLSKLIENIRDSKKLGPPKRESIYNILLSCQEIKWATSRVGEKIIDRINILEATKLAMKRAVAKLQKELGNRRIDFLVIDGNFRINSRIPQKSIIKGDEKVFSCIAASIIAKVVRDKTMKNYHKKFPYYRFDIHKGYPTRVHKRLLKKYGPCRIHRKSFAPVKKVIRTCLMTYYCLLFIPLVLLVL